MRRARRNGARGQALVEFAFVVPMFLLLMLALIDLSRLIFTYGSLANGAREMAREAAVVTNWSAVDAINAFKNTTIIAGGQDSTTDSVTVRVGNATCARALDTGATCTPTPTQTACPLPLSTTTCALVPPTHGGFVEVQASYTFQFNPLFQNRLAGILDVSFMRPTAVLTTTARAYAE